VKENTRTFEESEHDLPTDNDENKFYNDVVSHDDDYFTDRDI